MNEYVIGKYIRLSQDDAVSESMSIPHQRLLLDRHIEKLDLPCAKVLEFVDNGYTGTNLERPAFQEMIELVRCGKIDCIIVKDFSRFARHELESGYYIEQVFPLYRVRFIAVGDSFDSSDYKDGSGGMDMAFKFMIHEYYSKDLSKKVKSAKRAQMMKGEYIVAGAVHGYRKNDKGRWEPDPEAADVIARIFRMALDGLSTAQIRDKLFEARCPSPKEYSLMKQGKEVVPKFMWPTRSIYKILTNEQYTGSYVAGKHETIRVGSRDRIVNDKSEWIIIPDRHPAIVSKDDFERVQALLENPKELSNCKPEPSEHSSKCKTRIASGERKSSAVPYGYIIDDNGDWAVSEAAASVVKEVFDMALQGLSTIEISDRLCAAGYPTPTEQKKLDKGQDIQPTNRWLSQAIKDMLKDEQYVGTYIAGKTYQIATDKKYLVPKSEWIRIPGLRPAIIGEDVFAQVQAIRAESRKHMRHREYLLCGKAVCGCCGHALSYSDSGAKYTYRCMHTHADPDAKCHKMKVSAGEIESAVMAIIRKQAEVVLASDDLTGFQKTSASEKQAADVEKQIGQLTEQRQQCYESFSNCEIDRDTFRLQKAEYTAQIDMLTNQLAVIRQAERDKDANTKIAALANDALSDKATPTDIVNALIDKVLVFPGNHLEIHWKFANFA